MSTDAYPLSQSAAGHKLTMNACLREGNVAEAFNHFVMAWVDPQWHAHLLDDDDNAGERMRRAIRDCRGGQ